MSAVEVSTIMTSIVDLLVEAYAGPSYPSSTWFIDNELDSGILGILAGVSATEVSISVDGSGRSGTTIASHAEHLRWSLANLNATIRGADYDGNWNKSWEITQADPTQWDRLRQALRDEFETLRDLLKQQNELPEEYLTGLLAVIPHAAYHLGSIRQMVERVRE